jgi:hypothetical protein
MKKLLILVLLVFPARAIGQGYDRDRGRVDAEAREKKGAIAFQISSIAVGFGSFFDQESVTFSTDALYLPIQLHGVGLPFIKEGTSTGISVEVHPAKLFTVTEDGVRLQQFGQLDYRLWSITRVPISAIPWGRLQSGTMSRVFSGVDLLIDEGGEDFTKGFDQRMVLGGDLGVLGPGNFVAEIYMFQQDVPIAFSIFYGF